MLKRFPQPNCNPQRPRLRPAFGPAAVCVDLIPVVFPLQKMPQTLYLIQALTQERMQPHLRQHLNEQPPLSCHYVHFIAQAFYIIIPLHCTFSIYHLQSIICFSAYDCSSSISVCCWCVCECYVPRSPLNSPVRSFVKLHCWRTTRCILKSCTV